MTEIAIRPMDETDVEASIALVMGVFDKFVAPDFSAQGIASFIKWANPPALAERLRGGYVTLLAAKGDRIVGVIEWMPPHHVAMLFVDPDVQGEGIGRRLFDEALRRISTRHPDLKVISVHASRYAVPFYKRIGFREVAAEREEDGIRYIPMQLEL